MNRDKLADLLSEHRLLDRFERTGLSVAVNHMCSCTEWEHEAGGDWVDSHRSHVAAAVLPLIEADLRESIAGEIEASVAVTDHPDGSFSGTIYHAQYTHGIEDAARIVRGPSNRRA